jgi:GNAT superfamily N-acetyltransferase
MQIQISRYRELDPERREQIDRAAWVEFEKYAIVRETDWAEADWTFLGFEQQELVAFFNLVDRVVRFDDTPVRVAGLNNMVTLPAHRGCGHASRLLSEAQPRWFDEFGFDAGLLLCADALVPFYERLGWRKIRCPVVYAQPGGEWTWTASCMVLESRQAIAATRRVDLQGAPW